ncbi:30S ribosomal protein S1 [candidate division WOR-3 bacterium]|nr:30S ribosomal protein S1 [candidate division WOR-3 bacterium]
MAENEQKLTGKVKFVKETISPDDKEQLFGSYELKKSSRNMLTGKIISIGKKDVIVDIGMKSEGVIPVEEFDEIEKWKPGDTVDIFIESFESEDGLVLLSKKKADFEKVWDKIKESYDNNSDVEGKIKKRVKGGMIVNVLGVEAFLPGSQIDLHPIKDLDELIGKTMKFRIIKLNFKRRNIVVSHRIILEDQISKKKEELLNELEIGQVREGIVKNITDFGAFVDLGGVDGLLHITDISWGRINHPSEMFSVGDKIKVKIIGIDEEKNRVSLGMKQLYQHPWTNIDEKYPIGKRVKGTVTSITNYGAFVELEKGVEGLIHISEMSWTEHIKHPSQLLSIGDEIESIVLNIDKENEKISLGLKQAKPNPWELIAEKYPEGSIIEGKIRTLTNFGAFVEIEPGIDGLIYISDLSWTKRIEHPSEVLKKGETIKCKVLAVDPENKKISLGLKQMEEDPFETVEGKYPNGSHVEVEIVEQFAKGYIVELPNGLRGILPSSHLSKKDGEENHEYKTGDKLNVKIIQINKQQRKIVVSEKEFVKDQERQEVEEYLNRQEEK